MPPGRDRPVLAQQKSAPRATIRDRGVGKRTIWPFPEIKSYTRARAFQRVASIRTEILRLGG